MPAYDKMRPANPTPVRPMPGINRSQLVIKIADKSEILIPFEI
jgi:hypothetical protein